MNWTGCKLVEVNPLKLSGVPIVKGTRVQADAVIENFEDGLTVEEISDEFNLDRAVVQSLLTFAESHKADLAS